MKDMIARVDTMIWLAGQIYTDGVSDELLRFVEDAPPIAAFKDVFDMAETEGLTAAEVADEIKSLCARRGMAGFLFQVSMPKTFDHKGGSFSFSWGRYTSCWSYAETIDDVASAAVAFESKCLADDRAKAAA